MKVATPVRPNPAPRFRVKHVLGGFTVKAYVGRRHVGTVSAVRRAGRFLVAGAYVKPSWRRQGIGTALYERAGEEACAQGGPLVSDGFGRSRDATATWGEISGAREMKRTRPTGPPNFEIPCENPPRRAKDRDYLAKIVRGFGEDVWRAMEYLRSDPIYPRQRDRRRAAEAIALERVIAELAYRFPGWTFAGHERGAFGAKIERILDKARDRRHLDVDGAERSGRWRRIREEAEEARTFAHAKLRGPDGEHAAEVPVPASSSSHDWTHLEFWTDVALALGLASRGDQVVEVELRVMNGGGR